MESVFIKESLVSPKTILDKEQGIFEICGNSYMSNPILHYSVITEWLSEYVKDPLPETKFIFNLEYVNTATVKLLNDIISTLLSLREKGKKVEIEWHYNDDDEDMIDIGKQYEILNRFPFKWIKKN